MTSLPPRGWYPDPWHVAPWRWWDGNEWTPGLYGPYGEAWPLASTQAQPFVVKGPGIKGGGIAAVGVGIGLVGNIVVGVILLLTFGRNPSGTAHAWILLATEIPLWAGFVGAVLLASRRNGTRELKVDYGLSWPTRKDLRLGLSGGVLGRMWPLLLVILLVIANRESFTSPNSAAPKLLGVSPTSASGWVALIFLTVIGAPIVEELFFRGLVQGAFTRRIGDVPAIYVTALVFTFSHVLSEGPAAPLSLFPMALILGYLKKRTGRLAAGMVAHATFNASVLFLLFIPVFR